MDYNKIGSKIRKERIKQKLTIEELAYRADITPNYLGKIERAQTKLSLEVLIKIVNALGVSFDEIIGHELTSISQNSIDILSTNISNIVKKDPKYYEILKVLVDYMEKI